MYKERLNALFMAKGFVVSHYSHIARLINMDDEAFW